MSAIPQFSLDYSLPKPVREPAELPAFPVVATLLLATIAYLAIELPFAAALVDMFRSGPGHSDVHRMETTGRVVSGLALALVVWGFLLPKWMRDFPPVAVAFRMSLSALICVMTMSYGQRTLLDAIVDHSGPDSRQAAVRALVVRDAAERAGDASTPASASLLGLTGFMAWSDADNLSKIGKPGSALATYAVSTLPDADTLWNRYRSTIPAIDAAHGRYLSSVRSWLDAREKAGENAAREWSSLQWELRKRVRGPMTADVARETRLYLARKREIYVPHDWNPSDRAGFERAAVAKYVSNANRVYDIELRSALGPGPVPPKNLVRFDEFWGSDAVQERIKARFGFPDMVGRVPLARDRSGFEGAVMPAMRTQSVTHVRDAVSESPSALADGGSKEGLGREAVRAAFAPLLALGLSALGAAIHLLKLAHYGLMALEKARSTRTTRVLRHAAVAAMAACLVGAVAPSAEHASKVDGLVGPTPIGHAMKWIVATHGLVHPIGASLYDLPLLPALDRVVDAIPSARS